MNADEYKQTDVKPIMTVFRLVRGLVFAFLLEPTPVWAEICDKVRPSWNITNGRVGQLEEISFFFTEPIGIGLLCLMGLVLGIAVWRCRG